MIDVAAHILILDVVHNQLIEAFNSLVQWLCLRVEFLKDFQVKHSLRSTCSQLES